MYESSYVVNLRNKFLEGFNLKQGSIGYGRLTSLIIKFLKSSTKEAFRTIFQLLYEENSEIREKTLNVFGFTCFQNDTSGFTPLSESQIVLLGNELRYQYSQTHPYFLSIDNNLEYQEKYQEEFDTLKNAMQEHPLLLFRAVEFCTSMHKYEDVVSSSVTLLLSDSSSYHFNGLRKLGHNKLWANLLKPYAKQIGKLLQAMNEAYKKNQEELYGEQPDKYAEEPSNDRIEELNVDDKSLDHVVSEDYILKQFPLPDEVFTLIGISAPILRSDEFWDCLARLHELKIDFKLLKQLIISYDEWKLTSKNLANAIDSLECAKNDFNMNNFETIHRLSDAAKALEEATVANQTAFSKVSKCCEPFYVVA